jgi:hypothetical protein
MRAIERRIVCRTPVRVKLHRRMLSRTIEVNPRILGALCDIGPDIESPGPSTDQETPGHAR